jgi:hypothetical protein
LNSRCLHWKHHEVSIELQGLWKKIHVSNFHVSTSSFLDFICNLSLFFKEFFFFFFFFFIFLLFFFQLGALGHCLRDLVGESALGANKFT